MIRGQHPPYNLTLKHNCFSMPRPRPPKLEGPRRPHSFYPRTSSIHQENGHVPPPSRSDGSGRPQDRTSSHSGDPRNPVGRVRERPIPPGWCSSERPLGTQAPTHPGTGPPEAPSSQESSSWAPGATLRAVSGAKRLFPGARTPRGTWRSPLKQQPSRAHHAPGGRRPAAHLLAPPPRGTPPSFPAALFQLLPAGRRAQLTLPRAGLERWGGDDPSADRAQQVRSPCRPVQPVCQDFAQNFSARAAGE